MVFLHDESSPQCQHANGKIRQAGAKRQLSVRSVNCHNNAFFTEYGVIILVLMGQMRLLTLKAPNKNLQQMTLIFCYFYLSKKIRLDVSCEFSA